MNRGVERREENTATARRYLTPRGCVHRGFIMETDSECIHMAADNVSADERRNLNNCACPDKLHDVSL